MSDVDDPQAQPSSTRNAAADYHEIIVTDAEQHLHRYPMASAPVEDAGHNLDFTDGAGNPVHWELGTWDSWSLVDLPV